MCVGARVCAVYRSYMSTRLSYMKSLHMSKLYIIYTIFLICSKHDMQDLFFQMPNTKTIWVEANVKFKIVNKTYQLAQIN